MDVGIHSSEIQTVIDSGIVEAIQENGVQISEADLLQFQYLPEVSNEVTSMLKIADFQVFKSFEQFKDAFQEYQKSSMTTFCTSCNSKNFNHDSKYCIG